ncbi:MAG: guanylate kinase [Patescibacteria group bacterium]|jgi:guanylate kinase
MIADASRLIVVTGPSGVGKDTILETLKRNQLPLEFVLTTTTRPERPGEHHVYHHIDVPTFQKMITDGAFAEWAKVYDQYYGTELTELERAMNTGRTTILENDIQGAKIVKSLFPQSTIIFISPKDIEELETRLRKRGKNNDAEIRTRLDTAASELAQAHIADHVIINEEGKLDKAVSEIQKIIESLGLKA